MKQDNTTQNLLDQLLNMAFTHEEIALKLKRTAEALDHTGLILLADDVLETSDNLRALADEVRQGLIVRNEVPASDE